MARVSARKSHSIAIAGAGTTSFENVKDLLDDMLGFTNEIPEDDDTRILVVIAPEFIGRDSGMNKVVQWLDDWMLAYDVLIDNREPWADFGVKDFIANADNVYKMSAYVNQMTYAGAIAHWFEERDNDVKTKIILWNDGSDELTSIVKQRYDAPSFDLTSGLDSIEIEDEDPSTETPAVAVVRGELKETAEPLAEVDTPPWTEPVTETTEVLTEVPAEIGANDPTSIGTWTQFADEYKGAQQGPKVSETTTLATLDPNVVPILISSVDSAISQLKAVRAYLELTKTRSLSETAEFLSGSGLADTPGVVTIKPTDEDVVTPEPKRRGRPRKATV